MDTSLRWFGNYAAGALTAAVVAVAGCAAQDPPKLEGMEQKIETASTRLDHGAIALQYEQQAAADAASATRHQGYARIYRKNQDGPRSGGQQHLALATHCDTLAQTYQKAADENLAMAKLHRGLVGEAK